MATQLAEGLKNCDSLPRHAQAMPVRPIHQYLEIIHSKPTCKSLQLDYTHILKDVNWRLMLARALFSSSASPQLWKGKRLHPQGDYP
jgi:hypothetical protein